MDKPAYAVAIGSSTGGIEVLLQIAQALPRDFPAIVLVTQHIGPFPSLLPELMRSRGPNPALHPHDGDKPLPGSIYIAPPDHHLLFEDGRLRVLRGPKENHCRPAIDPMFRSVALASRSRAIGVVLTGNLDDGTAGLRAIQGCGGIAIVQDPATALEPSMPASALRHLEVDLCLPPEEIVPALLRIVGTRRPAGRADGTVRREQMILHGRKTLENLDAIGSPSRLTCPDCGGSLWELSDAQPLRYRCHTGHAFSAHSLAGERASKTEESLWAGVRSLQERAMLLRRVAAVAQGQGDRTQAQAARRESERAMARARELSEMIGEKGGAKP